MTGGRAVVSIALVWSVALTAGCARYTQRIDLAGPQPSLAPFAIAFERNPSVVTLEALHRHMRLGGVDRASLDAIVGAIANKDIEPRIVAAAAVDLATYAWGDSFATLRLDNLHAQRARSLRTVARTADLAWSMLALRAAYLIQPVDLSGMDLRDRSQFVGQSMNLRSVNFSGSRLSPAVWHDCNLTWASFVRARAGGALTCDRCFWEPGGQPQRKTFVRGRWLS
ncbi:MAG: hypothetical protein ABI431_06570 [Candidatus Tumulicola sp.]